MKIFSKISDNSFSFLVTHLSSKDICIDCGANVGYITEQMAKNSSTVYSFEPNPFAFKELKKKANSNPNVHVYNKGVWDRNATLKLYMHENSNQDEVIWSTGSSLLEYKGNVLKDKYIEVDIIDLVEFINNLKKKIKILKIDIEGAECELLEKLIITQTYKRIEHIFVETHDHKIPELKTKTDAIRSLIKQKKIKNINLNWI